MKILNICLIQALLLAHLSLAWGDDTSFSLEKSKQSTVRTPTPIQAEEMLQHIRFLASEELQGRNNAGAVAAANYIEAWFKELGLQPLFGDSYFQQVPDVTNPETMQASVIGRNIGGYIAGTDFALQDEIILVNAHYDHLGVRRGKIYPGADDNASGVAMLLETARVLSQANRKPRRTVAFVAFDLEEHLLWGSRWFVESPPWDIKQVKLCLTADMISRSLGGMQLPTVFVLGSEKAPLLKEVLRSVGTPEGLEVALMGIDLVGTRSDYGPFRDRQVPFLFFSTGEHPDYHRPTDTPDRVDSQKAAAIANLMLAVTREAADMEITPQWQDKISRPEADVSEAIALNRITELLLNEDDSGKHKLNNMQRFFVSQVESKTGYIIRKGMMSAEERHWLVRSAQMLMISVF